MSINGTSMRNAMRNQWAHIRELILCTQFWAHKDTTTYLAEHRLEIYVQMLICTVHRSHSSWPHQKYSLACSNMAYMDVERLRRAPRAARRRAIMALLPSTPAPPTGCTEARGGSRTPSSANEKGQISGSDGSRMGSPVLSCNRGKARSERAQQRPNGELGISRM